LRKGLERSRGGQPQTAAAAAAATTSTCSTHGKDHAETGEATKLYVPNLTIRALRAEWWLGSKERHRMASTES
jgi:hypothetical protein